MSGQQNVQAALERLFNSSNMAELLENLYSLKLLLSSRHTQVPEGTVERLFGLLGQDSTEVLELTCNCIDLILTNVKYRQLVETYQSYLELGIQSQDVCVKNLALNQICKCLASKEEIASFVRSNLLKLILYSLDSPSVGYTEKVVVFLCKLTKQVDDVSALFDPEIIKIYQQLAKKDDLVRFRLWNFIVPVCCDAELAFEKFEQAGLLIMLLKDVNSKDSLIATNAVSLVAALADTEYALKYLSASGTIREILNWGVPKEDTEPDRLPICSVLKFIGRLGEAHDLAKLDREFSLLDRISMHISSQDFIIREVAIRAVGMLGRSSSGLAVLSGSKLLSEFVAQTMNALGEKRVPCLETLAILLTPKESEPRNAKCQSAELLFRQLDEASRPRHSGFISVLVGYLKQAFEDLRLASYATLFGIASYTWGCRLIVNHHGCVTFLLDRNVEPASSGKKWKYLIIRTLVDTPDAAQIIERRTLDHFRRYLQEGIYYKAVEAAVAFESAT